MRRTGRRFVIALGIFAIAAAIVLSLFLNSIYRLPILMYHAVDEVSGPRNRLVVPPEIFANQMRYLHERGYAVVTLDEAVSYITQNRRLPRKTVAITFDDGYENNYTYAYPVLVKYHIPAAIFVIVRLVGTEGFLTWDQIREMSRSGIVNIESHSTSHLWLTGLDARKLKEELESSRKVLEDALNKKVRYLCYPMGGYDERVKSAAREAGYSAAFATKPKTLLRAPDLYAIDRVKISLSSDNPFVFAIKVSGYHAFFRTFKDDYGEIAKKLWKKRSSL